MSMYVCTYVHRHVDIEHLCMYLCIYVRTYRHRHVDIEHFLADDQYIHTYRHRSSGFTSNHHVIATELLNRHTDIRT